MRRAAFCCLAFPPLTTAAIVLGNRLTDGGLHFFVGGAPWTFRFWSGLFYMLVAGVFLSLLTLARVCPRCGNGFHSLKGYNPRHARRSLGRTGHRFNVTVFTSRCLNCALRLDGSDLSTPEAPVMTR